MNRVLVKTLTSESEEEIVRICLAAAEGLTASVFGFIGTLNENGRFDTIAQSDTGWAACRMPDAARKMLVKDMEVRGYWARTIRQGRAQIVNDPAADPDSRGTPDGHPPITAFLGIPLLHGEEVRGMIALANKLGGHDNPDKAAVEQLAVIFVQALDRLRAQQALRESHLNLEKIVEVRTRKLSDSEAEVKSARDRLNTIL
ncbi:MAG: GAF domain-containing protein, partial [Desulfobulbales bacterium]|nr:GAF domain-containing protein [Desulfobulbales bacterium]